MIPPDAPYGRPPRGVPPPGRGETHPVRLEFTAYLVEFSFRRCVSPLILFSGSTACQRCDGDMTAQRLDEFLVQGDRHDLAAVTGGPLFDPTAFGLQPKPQNTASWRGWHGTYRADERLELVRLVIGSDADPPPELQGRRPVRETHRVRPVRRIKSDFCWIPWGGTRDYIGEEETVETGAWQYDGLSIRVPFTGGLLLGTDFIISPASFMEFSFAWTYERVLEVVAEGGEICGVFDRSAEIAARLIFGLFIARIADFLCHPRLRHNSSMICRHARKASDVLRCAAIQAGAPPLPPGPTRPLGRIVNTHSSGAVNVR